MKRLVLAALFSFAAFSAHAGPLDAISNTDATAGVREALSKGADIAVAALGKPGGFLGNEQVKIKLPGALDKAQAGLRMVGMGKQTDQLVETMNHAAENAVAEARPILADAIKKMSVQDAKGILTGGDNSVTQYFQRTSTEALMTKFQPIVKAETSKLGVGELYGKVAGKAAGLGIIDQKESDLDGYVTQKAMDGLFKMIAEEEKKLRADPVGAGSSVLKKVFGALL